MMILATLSAVGPDRAVWAQDFERAPRVSSLASQELLGELLYLKEETVVTAIRKEQPISQAPSNMYVITDEEIRRSGAIDLPTVLRQIPGLDVIQTSGADFNVSARGDNQAIANKLLVLVDGRPIFLDVQATVNWKVLPVTLPEIKRIEVLKGPAGAIYGFNAFDGVINIITKSPAEMVGATVQVGAGQYGTISSAAIVGGQAGKLGYRLSAGHDQNQQWNHRNSLAFRSDKFNVVTDYAVNSTDKVTFSGGVVDANRFDGPIAENVYLATRPAQSYANAVYEGPSYFLRAYWTRYEAEADLNANPLLTGLLKTTDRYGNPTSALVTNTYNIEGQHALELASAHHVLYGFNYRRNTAASNFLLNASEEDRVGLYTRYEWRLAEPLTLDVGARYEINTFINPTVSPRAALLYRPWSEHTFRAAWTVGYRPPSILETFTATQSTVTLPLPSPYGTYLATSHGSNSLEPEKIVSYELDYQGWYLQHCLRLRASLFFNHVSNLINARPTAPGSTVSSFVNDAGAADILGGEAGAEYLATSWLSGFANVSYQDIQQTFTDTVRRGGPRYKANAGLRASSDSGLTADALVHFVGSATYPVSNVFVAFAPFYQAAQPGTTPPNPHVGSYTLVNLRSGYRIWKAKSDAGYERSAEVALSTFNALNDKHKEHPLGERIGSRVMGWVTIHY
jgi:iron complex outermembrane receptor protein